VQHKAAFFKGQT